MSNAFGNLCPGIYSNTILIRTCFHFSSYRPGHWWPVLLLPLYGIAELIPSLRQKARTRAFVTIKQMLRTLVDTVEQKPVAHSINEKKIYGKLKLKGNFF
jgi:hypothetical protein